MTRKTTFIILIILLCIFLFFGRSVYSPEKSIQDVSTNEIDNGLNCPEEEYNLDCGIVKYLKSHLGWTNRKEARLFCSYDYIGEAGNEIYLKTECESFYVVNKETVCPDSESANDCFISKKCESCEQKSINPKIALDSGISIPVKLTKTDGDYKMEKPSDGSLYEITMKEIFPLEIIDKISASKNKLSLLNIEMAEAYFKAEAYFEAIKNTENACNIDSDCFSILESDKTTADCPKDTKCINKKCSIGCYDFIDYQELPKTK